MPPRDRMRSKAPAPTQQQFTAPAPVQRAAPAPTYQLQGGFDLSGPSASEYSYAQNAGQLQAPSAQEGFAADPSNYDKARSQTATGQYWNGMQGGNNTPREMTGERQVDNGATASGQNWGAFQASAPANMGAYYDRQYERGSNRINAQSAARGQFNSSSAMDRQGQFAADLGAQQARDEASYGLQRAAEARASAGQADSAGLGRFQAQSGNDLNRFNAQTGYDLSRSGQKLQAATAADASAQGRYGQMLTAAQGADSGMLGRLGLLGQGASAADNARLQRTDTTFNNLAGLSGQQASQLGGMYSGMLEGDQGMYDMTQQLGLGAGAQNLAFAQQNGQQRMANAAQTTAATNQAIQTGIGAAKYLL